MFYPVFVNATYNTDGKVSAANGEVYKVYPNKNYICKVVIKTKGLTGGGPKEDDQPAAGHDELKPETAAITVTVANWDSFNQTTTFE